MRNNNKLENDLQVLSKVDRKAFEKISGQLLKIGWDPISEYDPDWGWVILATINQPDLGLVLRRIKPFAINSISDIDKALKAQNHLRSDLVEVSPYKVFMGNKISVSDVYKPFNFPSEADLSNWTKFFKSKNISLKSKSIDVPVKKRSD